MKTWSSEWEKLASLIRLFEIVHAQFTPIVTLGRSQSVRAKGNDPRYASIAV